VPPFPVEKCVPFGARLACFACAFGVVAWACDGPRESNPLSIDEALDGGSDVTGSGARSGASARSGSGASGTVASSGSSGEAGAGGMSPASSSGGGSVTSAGGVPATGSMCPHVSAGDYELSSLPPTTGLPSGVLALTDWGQRPAHGGWYGAQQMDACRYQADPGLQTWHGKPSARLEVDPGDDPLNLGENSERAECLIEQYETGGQLNEGPSSGILFYATSYYFSTSWSATFYPNSVFESGGGTWPGNVSSDCIGAGNLCNSWSIVLQFHGPGGGTPWAVLAAGSTAPGQPQKMWLTGGGSTVQFSDGGEIVPGAWVDLVLEVDWGTGGLSIWRRNQGQTAFTLVVTTMMSAPVNGTYMKQGLYRGGQVNGRTDVLWVGPTARGSSFVSVEQAAFGTSVGPSGRN